MTVLRPLLSACVPLVLAAAAHAESFIKPGRSYVVVDTPRLHVILPTHQLEHLRGFIARADLIYERLARDAGYPIRRRLNLLLTDDAETHNGFSTVVPFPLVDVELAPAQQQSFIFDGAGSLERTLVHELAHHISNDRQFNGLRRTLETIFGRVLPHDYASLLIAYLSVPSHVTMPSFWHEGVAQWAETVYADPTSAWAGRGRDSLTHMVWRLDAASPEGIPRPGDWRITYHRWPFGSRAYLYGLAYTRWLDAAYEGKASIWQLIERQQHRWAFAFNGGPEELVGMSHLELIAQARAALAREQAAQLAIIRGQPVTQAKRLTPADSRWAAPAWVMKDKAWQLFAAYDDPYGRPKFATVDVDGNVDKTGHTAWAMGESRSLGDGTLVFNETPQDTSPWERSRVVIVTPRGKAYELPGKRLFQPDVRRVDVAAEKQHRYQVAAIQLLDGGRQQLVIGTYDIDESWFGRDRLHGWNALDGIAAQDRSHGIPWSPSFRPGSDELCWVETHQAGSRLVIATVAPSAGPSTGLGIRLVDRRVLAEVRGRIYHPAWTTDGARVYFCADHSGVGNAYALDVASPGALIPVTNTIGSVVACVPSFDGRELAIIDYDHRGPFLSRIPADPATWPKQVPRIALDFPAPLGGVRTVADDTTAPERPADAEPPTVPNTDGAAPPPRRLADDAPRLGVDPADGDRIWAGPDRVIDMPRRFMLPEGEGDAAALEERPYRGLLETRPLFWTPSTLVVPEGGFGAIAVAADRLFTHEIVLSAGIGPIDAGFVGLAGYVYSGWPLDLSAVGWRAERGYDQVVVDVLGDRWDYAERTRTAEARIGYGLAGLRRRHSLYVAGGISDRRPIHDVTDDYALIPLVTRAPFVGTERYLEATLAYDDSTFFPTSYAAEDGHQLAVSYRHYGFGGDREGDRILGRGTTVLTVWPSQSHQIVAGGIVGWSEGDRWLQGEFALGGATGATLPRGYLETEAVGDYFAAYSVAYRAPLWRPFTGFSTTPFAFRQVVLEAFFDAAKASRDRIVGDGEWYRSAGGELHLQWEVWYALVDPGIGVAQQLDGDEDTTAYLTLQFGW